jgi:hypothetical protein
MGHTEDVKGKLTESTSKWIIAIMTDDGTKKKKRKR